MGVPTRYLSQVARDGFGHSALFRAEPRVGAGRVDEGDDRLAELGPQLHEAQGLAVSLGVRHAEVARDVLPGVAPLLVPDGHDRVALEAREPAHDGLVVAEDAISVQLDEILEEKAEQVERVGPLRMPGKLGPLPRGQAAVDLLLEALQALIERPILARPARRPGAGSAIRFSARGRRSDSSSSGILDESCCPPRAAFRFLPQLRRDRQPWRHHLLVRQQYVHEHGRGPGCASQMPRTGGTSPGPPNPRAPQILVCAVLCPPAVRGPASTHCGLWSSFPAPARRSWLVERLHLGQRHAPCRCRPAAPAPGPRCLNATEQAR